MRRKAFVAACFLLVTLAASPNGRADRIIKIGVYSQNVSGHEAAIGARIKHRTRRPGRRAVLQVAKTPARESSHVAQVPRPESSAPVYPTIPSNSPLLRNPEPFGPGSFWYQDESGNACQYAPDSVLPCFRVVSPGTGGTTPAPGISPTAVAAAVADRLSLRPGVIHMSPSASGLTGAASWFWLDPAPRTETLSVWLGGETVTVTAEPEIEWRFGDGAAFTGGAGVPYRPGPPPSEAITHIYGTRCLPGDRGRNPYVLASCGGDGYAVEAVVSWRISYQASGPVGADGSLPSRTTETSAVYPVSEARAFLFGGGSR